MVQTFNHKIRIVTAASLFDGHDAAINLMRRLMQASGAEIIHLGHNRSVAEIVDCAIQEDVQGIAVTSYQGGHLEFFKYMYDLLQERGAGHIKIFGGGGGTILPHEIDELHAYGIAPPQYRIQDGHDDKNLQVPCPLCASTNTELLSQFGSTSCKALYKCQDCLEPFDYFKCHRRKNS